MYNKDESFCHRNILSPTLGPLKVQRGMEGGLRAGTRGSVSQLHP